jgi:hypothetical protein
VPQTPSEASEGCRAEARRAKADRCSERRLRKPIIAGKTGEPAPPNQNIENNPMQRNNVVDALSDPANDLTRRANQRHYCIVAYHCSASAAIILPLHYSI